MGWNARELRAMPYLHYDQPPLVPDGVDDAMDEAVPVIAADDAPTPTAKALAADYLRGWLRRVRPVASEDENLRNAVDIILNDWHVLRTGVDEYIAGCGVKQCTCE